MFPAVRRPDGGTFFERNGLLFLSEQEVRDTTQKLVTAQPFLGAAFAKIGRDALDGMQRALDAQASELVGATAAR